MGKRFKSIKKKLLKLLIELKYTFKSINLKK